MSEARPFRPPADLLEIAERLESVGHQAWAVGGALRDALLGRRRCDWDIATDARPAEVRKLFRRTVPLGVEHGTVGVFSAAGTMYEVTTFRLDIETDGRHAVVEFAGSVEEDLARRDFTLNAMAWRPATDEIRDPFGGREDLDTRTLRAVGEADRRFAEDHLRVLRGLRFAGAYGLEIEDSTRAALLRAVPRLGDLSAERVREEFLKVLGGARPSASLRLYAECGALEDWYPELAAVADEPAWIASLGAVDALRPHRPFLRVVRLALSAGLAGEGENLAEPTGTLLHRLRFSNAEIRRGAHLARHYLPLLHPAESSAGVREWLHLVGKDHARDLFRLHFCGARARREDESRRALAYTWRRVHDEILRGSPTVLSDLAIDGDDLLELGLPKGPIIGLMLEELLAQVLEDPEANQGDELRRRARDLMELGALDRLTGGEEG